MERRLDDRYEESDYTKLLILQPRIFVAEHVHIRVVFRVQKKHQNQFSSSSHELTTQTNYQATFLRNHFHHHHKLALDMQREKNQSLALPVVSYVP